METKRAGHAFEIARDLDTSKYTVLVCISGDGMLHEIINGLAKGSSMPTERMKNMPICILPAGTSNGVATNMTSSDPFDAVVALIEGGPVPTDLYSMKKVALD